jgi:hypothetical protein
VPLLRGRFHALGSRIPRGVGANRFASASMGNPGGNLCTITDGAWSGAARGPQACRCTCWIFAKGTAIRAIRMRTRGSQVFLGWQRAVSRGGALLAAYDALSPSRHDSAPFLT